MARYEAGETLASIAKTYDCSPPAISYIVSRSRARHANGTSSPAVMEPQLIKTHPQTSPEPQAALTLSPPAAVQNGAPIASSPVPIAGDAPQLRPQHGFADDGEPADRGNSSGLTDNRPDKHRNSGFPGLPPAAMRPEQPAPAPAPAPQASYQQRVPHLELGSSSASVPNGAAAAVSSVADRNSGDLVSDRFHDSRDGITSARHSLPQQSNRYHLQRQSPPAASRPDDQPRYGYPQPNHSHRPTENEPRSKDHGPYIDKDLRARVDTDIAAFLSAFDAALAQDSQDSRSALREATDRLLRAGARTRIELERLEARVPLSSRDPAARSVSAWRPR